MKWANEILIMDLWSAFRDHEVCAELRLSESDPEDAEDAGVCGTFTPVGPCSERKCAPRSYSSNLPLNFTLRISDWHGEIAGK